MQVIVPLAGTKKPNCEIEYQVNRFVFVQGDISYTIRGSKALTELVTILTEYEQKAMSWVYEDQDQVAVWSATGLLDGTEVSVQEEQHTRLFHAVHVGPVAFDLDSVWLVRAFIQEALRQETVGVFTGLG